MRNIVRIKKEKALIKSMSINALLRPCSMFISLVYTPLLLNYLGDEQYGIWTTILAVMNWLTIFDFGIGGGYRNLLSKKISEHQTKDIKELTATAYFSLSSIVSVIFVFCLLIINITDWRNIFNTKIQTRQAVFFVLIFVCLNFIFGLTNSIFYASQKSELVSIITIGCQLLNLSGIFLLNIIPGGIGNRITSVSILYCLASVFVNITVLIIVWIKCNIFIPRLSFFNKQYFTPIFQYGFKLFFIQISGIILFATDSMIITQLFSPADVTPYSITRSAFNVINSVFIAMVSPFWSKYTLENSKKNFSWIKKSIKIQIILWLIFVSGMIVFGFVFKMILYLWIGRDLAITSGLITAMVILMSTEMFTAIFSNFLNGVSYVDLQLKVSIIGAALNIPVSVILAKHFCLGTTGVCLGTVICQVLGCLALPFDTIRYLHKKEKM